MVLTAYVLPPFGDLFDFEWSVDRPAAAVERAGHPDAGLRAGRRAVRSHDLRVTARGIKPYPDPDQAEIPPSLSAGCALSMS